MNTFETVHQYNDRLEKRIRKALFDAGATPANTYALRIDGMHIITRGLFSDYTAKRGVRVSVSDPKNYDARTVSYTLNPGSTEEISDESIAKVVKKVQARVAALQPMRVEAQAHMRKKQKVIDDRRKVADSLKSRLVAAGIATEGSFIRDSVADATLTLTFAQFTALLALAERSKVD